MAAIILDVIQISSANDWYSGCEWDDVSTLEPIAFFALVLTFDPQYPSLAASKATIAITSDKFSDDFLGMSVNEFPKNIVHSSKLSK